jgi:hypothetical protein
MARRRAFTTITVAAALATTAAWGPAAQADTLATPDPAVVCASMKTDVFRVTNPQTDASLVTPWAKEVNGSAARAGFTEDGSALFKAASTEKAGLVPVYRLYSPTTGDFLWVTAEGDRNRAVRFGYTLQSPNFFVSADEVPCGIPVYRYVKGTKHRMSVSDDDRAALEADGWTSEGARFYAMPADGGESEPPVEQPPVVEPPVVEPPVVEPPVVEPPAPQPPTDGDSTFTLAVMPDTQQDEFSPRLTNRTQWLVKNQKSLDLRFVLHTGDMVNWDTPNHDQFEDASKSFKVLDNAQIPYALTIGNHDTNVVDVGGNARPGLKPWEEVRNTTTFNTYFPTSRQKPEGVFEQGKVDNNYQLFSAGGEDWMILTLELWPRAAAVNWARGVVEAHPDRNIIVQTHSYMNGNGSIYGGADYGATSPKKLYAEFISVYPNIKMVLSGHVGTAAQRVDTGKAGNKIVSFLGTFHTSTHNPMRLLKIDTAADTVTSTMYSPINDVSFPQYAGTWSGMSFD